MLSFHYRSIGWTARIITVLVCVASCAEAPRKADESVSSGLAKHQADSSNTRSTSARSKTNDNALIAENKDGGPNPDIKTKSPTTHAESGFKSEAVRVSYEDLFESDASGKPGSKNDECDDYLKNKVRSNISFPQTADNLIVSLHIMLNQDRLIEGVRVRESSGNPAFDQQVVRGIWKSERLPVICPLNVFYNVHHREINNYLADANPVNPSLTTTPKTDEVIPPKSAQKPSEESRQKDAPPAANVKKAGYQKEPDLHAGLAASGSRESKDEVRAGEFSGKEKKGADGALSELDGEWYSHQWKYGYTLKNGKGYATITNSPHFEVGQEIVRLTPVGGRSFVGENIYKDGKFYSVKATLQADGKLFFEGEKNVKWTMARVNNPVTEKIKNTTTGSTNKTEKKVEEILVAATALINEASAALRRRDYQTGCKKFKSGVAMWKKINPKDIPIENKQQFSRLDTELREFEVLATLMCTLY